MVATVAVYAWTATGRRRRTVQPSTAHPSTVQPATIDPSNALAVLTASDWRAVRAAAGRLLAPSGAAYEACVPGDAPMVAYLIASMRELGMLANGEELTLQRWTAMASHADALCAGDEETAKQYTLLEEYLRLR